jgi:hypothetical protein
MNCAVICPLAVAALIASATASLAQAPGSKPPVTQQQAIEPAPPRGGVDETVGRALPSQFEGPRTNQRPDACWITPKGGRDLGYWGPCTDPYPREDTK